MRSLASLIPRIPGDPLEPPPTRLGDNPMIVARVVRRGPRARSPLLEALAADGAERPAPPAPPPDPVAEAEARGRTEAEAEAEARFSAERDALARTHAAALAEARASWATREGEALADRLSGALDRLAERLGRELAGLLEPFVVAEVRHRAVAALADEVRAILARRPATWLEVTGPGDLLAAFRARLGPAGAGIALTEDPAEVDVRVVAENTIFQTTIGRFLEEIARGAATAGSDTPVRAGPADGASPVAAAVAHGPEDASSRREPSARTGTEGHDG